MKKKLTIALALVLVIVMSVAGTLAYLTDKTSEVKNTFTVGSIFDPDDPEPIDDPIEKDAKFVLHEHKATADASGVYTLGKDEVLANEYTVLPGVNLPKDPFVRTNYDLALDAYVFIEVVDKTAGALTVTVDTANWTAVSGATPKHEGGVVYVLADNSGIAAAGSKLAATTILDKNTIAVDNTEITNPGEVSFYGYMIQAAGFTSAAAAWEGLNPST